MNEEYRGGFFLRVRQAEMRKENYLMVAIKYLSSYFAAVDDFSLWMEIIIFLGDDLTSLRISTV
jgi:hypothetical protein